MNQYLCVASGKSLGREIIITYNNIVCCPLFQFSVDFTETYFLLKINKMD